MQPLRAEYRLAVVNRQIAVLVALALASVTACSSSSVGLALAAVPRASADPGDAALAARAANAFAFDLLRKAIPAGKNGVLSPTSVALALAMARAGARGQTAAQMDAVLREVASDPHAGWLNALEQALATRSGTFKDTAGKDTNVTLRIANAPFAQRDLAFVPAYLDALASRYGAGIRLVDFKKDPEAARAAVNAWVKDETEQRIPELIAKGTVDDLTRLILVNAIYLKAAWRTAFLESATAPARFVRLDGSTIDVPTMQETADLSYAAGPGWKAVELPYVGDSLAMTVIVPDDLASFEAALDGPGFDAITTALQPTSVRLSFPKFGLETMADVGDVLKALGMPDAFNKDLADFSGMTTADRLYISAVIHQANLDVDEQGIEASAATAVVLGTTSMPVDQVTFQVDHPFLFALRDTKTGAILFLGRVAEPAIRA
jgi:serine protease inhibitor